MQLLPFLLSEIQKRKVEFLGELKNISTKRKIGKTTYELLVHFNENATEIMLRELRRKSDEKKDDFD